MARRAKSKPRRRGGVQYYVTYHTYDDLPGETNRSPAFISRSDLKDWITENLTDKYGKIHSYVKPVIRTEPITRRNPASDWSWLSFLLGLTGGAALAAFAIKQQSTSTSSTSMTTTNP